MHSNGYTFGFAAAIAITCSLLLSVLYTNLKPLQDKNVDTFVKKNILKVSGVDVTPTTDIQKVFEERLELKFVDIQGNFVDLNDADTKRYRNFVKEFKNVGLKRNVVNTDLTAAKDLKLPLYLKKDNSGNVERYIIPVHGMGLWSLLEGYLALESDLNTVAGITFYEQKETAGLGAEVQAAWFPANFPGKKIYDDAGKLVGVIVKKGVVDKSVAYENTHMVDGISGATITGNGVSEFLLKDLTLYEPAFKKILGSKKTESVSADATTTEAVN